jgi:hypothetical protein
MSNSRIPLGEGYLKCKSCGYETPPFNHGGDNTQVFYCRKCADIVNPEALPFLFVPPPCSRCGSQLLREDRIYTAHLSGNDRIKCPKCHEASLSLHYICDISFDHENGLIPEEGQIIHGCVIHPNDGRLSLIFISPWLPLKLSMNSTLTNGSMTDLPDGYYEFIVKNVEEERLLLEYKGQLPKSVWGGYFRPASEPEPEFPKRKPVPTVPCPKCGEPLRTSKAQQCFHCGADWHEKLMEK